MEKIVCVFVILTVLVVALWIFVRLLWWWLFAYRGGLPNCPCPPMPHVKPPKEPRETFHFPAGMNYSTCAEAMKIQPLSLDAISFACFSIVDTATRAVVITTCDGWNLLQDNMPLPEDTDDSLSLCSVPFLGVPVRKYADEGMARAAAIIAGADGYEVMLFIPESGQLPTNDKDQV